MKKIKNLLNVFRKTSYFKMSLIGMIMLSFLSISCINKKDFFFKGGMFAFLIYNRQELYSTLILLLYACLFIYTIYSFNTLKIKLKENNNMSK